MEFIKKNKAFCLFALLALLIILGAVFAPVITGGISPTDAVLRKLSCHHKRTCRRSNP